MTSFTASEFMKAKDTSMLTFMRNATQSINNP